MIVSNNHDYDSMLSYQHDKLCILCVLVKKEANVILLKLR